MIKRCGSNAILLLLLFFHLTSFAQHENQQSEGVTAKIKVVQKDKFATVYATVLNETKTYQDNLSYSILNLKQTQSGNLSKNVQSGLFALDPEENKILSSSTVNLESNSSLKVFLYIKRDSMTIAKDTLTITNKTYEPQQKTANTVSSDPVLTGLILDNAITKLGRDFSEKLQGVYRINEVKFPFNTIINEKPLFGGRNSEIEVIADNKRIFVFNAQPNEEYLDHMAQHVFKLLNKYHKQREFYKLRTKKF
ncbi:MAG: hypothetical protein CR968_05525 [Flavobacteriia bacterium]|nr:MAG: hypothetical protein CR968_05525 [Flavobacteriia bacterium]